VTRTERVLVETGSGEPVLLRLVNVRRGRGSAGRREKAREGDVSFRRKREMKGGKANDVLVTEDRGGAVVTDVGGGRDILRRRHVE
jgi:hypothetical protein